MPKNQDAGLHPSSQSSDIAQDLHDTGMLNDYCTTMGKHGPVQARVVFAKTVAMLDTGSTIARF